MVPQRLHIPQSCIVPGATRIDHCVRDEECETAVCAAEEYET
jgi:hypothetical protein